MRSYKGSLKYLSVKGSLDFKQLRVTKPNMERALFFVYII